MPKAVFIRHGEPLKPPDEALKFGSCRQLLLLAPLIAEYVKPYSIIFCGDERESVVTARTLAGLIKGEIQIDRAFSEVGTLEDEDRWAESALRLERGFVGIDHRPRVRPLFQALLRASGKEMRRVPTLPYKLLDFRHAALAFDTGDMLISRLVPPKKR